MPAGIFQRMILGMGFVAPPDAEAVAALLVMGREAAGLTQGRLASRLSELAGAPISQGYVSKVEAGVLTVDPGRLPLFAAVLGLTPGLLADTSATIWALGDGCDYQRKRASTGVKAMRKLHATLNLIRLAMVRLQAVAGLREQPFLVTRTFVQGSTSAEDVARAIRKQFQIPPGPLKSVTALTEAAGAWVMTLPMGIREVDAASLHPADHVPLFVVNNDTSAERTRFSLAHELGHAACQARTGTEELTADRFASELLMPAKDILPELRQQTLSLARLRELKRRWRVSAAALARRSHDLGVTTDSNYRSLVIQMSGLGWKKNEPDSFDPERPIVVCEIVRAALRSQGSISKLAEAAGTSTDQFDRWFSASLVGQKSGGGFDVVDTA